MKRTVAGVVLLAGLGGGCTSMGAKDHTVAEGAMPFGQASLTRPMMKPSVEEPVVTAAAQMPTDTKTKKDAKQADYRVKPGAASGVSQTAGFSRVLSHKSAANCATGDCDTGPGLGHGHHGFGHGGGGLGSPAASGLGYGLGHGAGVLPVPAMGPWGAVAAVGANGPGSGMGGGMYANGRTSVRFANPAGMKIGWQTAPGAFSDSGLEAPARYNFAQMNTYRLRLSGIPNRPGRQFYPTLEVYPATLQTVTFLAHSTVPVTFTDEDFEQATTGSLVTKVVYLPSERFQDLAAVAGAEEIVSTRLEPGVDPVAEAHRRGTILLVIRLGNADLQDPNTPALDAPIGGMGLPPGAMPVGGPSALGRPTAPPSVPTLPTGTPRTPNMVSAPPMVGQPVSRSK